MRSSRTQKRSEAWARERAKMRRNVAAVANMDIPDVGFETLNALWKRKKNLFDNAIGDLTFPAYGGVAKENINVEKKCKPLMLRS